MGWQVTHSVFFDRVIRKNAHSERGLLVPDDPQYPSEFYLSPEIIEWITRFVSEEQLQDVTWQGKADTATSSTCYHVNLPTPELALLFKLTWGGL